ncbi:MAG: hypothetical protein A2162_11705 [Deltaproteobacteria bacterium RBG_13_52_11b]|nr:MAG: hypothetical protein A2162_11705 [Deltaproteobacteria bacterium RBG_13_52_11b]
MVISSGPMGVFNAKMFETHGGRGSRRKQPDRSAQVGITSRMSKTKRFIKKYYNTPFVRSERRMETGGSAKIARVWRHVVFIGNAGVDVGGY